METQYLITISIRMPAGMLEIGRFLIGNIHSYVLNTFESLNGSRDIAKSVLRIDLIKNQADELPLCLESMGCTLDEYVENCRIITRDAFKFFTLEHKEPGVHG